ncbi:acid-sensing ion channel 3-like [Lineus longissimus]|uniref:acid-sensing ion channel 3-like n=1 Tax=Lineus longissimus TaxID=88925 RepID=UPI00315D1C63
MHSFISSPGSIEFPSVTICNLNPVRKSALENANGAELQELKLRYQEMNVFADKLAKALSSPNENSDNVILNESLVEYRAKVSSILQRTGYLNALGHKKDIFIQECRFRGKRCDPSNFSLQVSPKYGNCFTFNSNELLKEPLKTWRAGPNGGLHLVLNIEPDEYLPFVAGGYGARVAIHEFGTFAFVQQDGVSVSSGLRTLLELTMACEIAELDFLTVGECKCQQAEFEVPLTTHANIPFCNETKEGAACLKSILQGIFEGTGSWRTWNAATDKNCKMSCREKLFKVKSSSDKWPQESTENFFTLDACQRARKMNPSHVCSKPSSESNFVALVLSYDNTRYENVVLVPDLPLSELQANVGGTLGLWAGISLLTLTEFIVLIMELLRILLRNRGRADISNLGGSSGDAQESRNDSLREEWCHSDDNGPNMLKGSTSKPAV